MKKAFVVALFLTLAAAPALAQGTGQGAVGAAFGGAAPVGLLHDELDPSFAVSGFGTWPVSGLLSVRVSGAYDGFRPLPDDRAACTAAGVEPSAIELDPPSLERVFLHLTGHGLRD